MFGIIRKARIFAMWLIDNQLLIKYKNAQIWN